MPPPASRPPSGLRRLDVRAAPVVAAVLSAAALAGGTPALAEASSVAVRTDLAVAEVPATAVVSGTSDGPARLRAGMSTARAGCDELPFDAEIAWDRPVAPGPFVVSAPVRADAPVAQVLCAELADADAHVVAAAALPVTPRAPRTRFAFSVPHGATAGHRVEVGITGVSEAPRTVTGVLAAPGGTCAAAFEAPSSPRLGLVRDARTAGLRRRVRVGVAGTWRVCARARRHAGSADVTDVVAEMPLRVVVACPSCGPRRARSPHRRACG